MFVLVFGASSACGGDSSGGGEAGSGAAASGGGGHAGHGVEAGAAPGGSGGQGGTVAGGGGAAGPAEGGELHGSFEVVLQPASTETGVPATTTVVGKLYDGRYPTPNAWREQDAADGCKLSTPEPVLCQPACRGGVCIAENTCMPYPAAVTVGAVELNGLGASSFRMEPVANSYQPPAGTTLPNPPCTPGAEVTLAAEGGSYPAFMLTAACIAPLEVADGVKITRGEPLMLSWNAPATPDDTRILVKLDISHHGGTKGVIECDVADTGSLAIPAKLVDALVELGVSGFPSVEVTRSSESTPPPSGPENVALHVTAPVRQAVEIDGLVSCMSDDTQCPPGQTCQEDLRCE